MEERRNAGPYVCDGCGETFNRKDAKPFEAFRGGAEAGMFHSIECYAASNKADQELHRTPSR